MITSDFHMHTNFSIDSDISPRDMIEGALAKGLTTICITDHNDKDYPVHEDIGMEGSLFDLDRYFQELGSLREEYADRIDVRIGIEIGLQPHLGEYYKELVSQYPFDFVIGSVHVVNGEDPYYQKMFETRTDEDAYRETFEVTLEDIESVQDFDVLGHIDYVVRYGKKQAQEYSYRKYADILDEILKSDFHGEGDRDEYGRIQVRSRLLPSASGCDQAVQGARRRGDHNRRRRAPAGTHCLRFSEGGGHPEGLRL